MTSVKATFWYIGTLIRKFVTSMIFGITLTPCFDLLGWFLVNYIFKRKGAPSK